MIEKSFIITGGVGSFGQAFTQRLLNLGAERIVIFSRCEVRQAEMAEKFSDHKHRLRFFIGDVRDRDRMRRAFEGVEVVVHAAALKRIETGHYNPGEMVKTNVLGAMNVIEAAHDAGVKKVVALSTDKAFQPISPYGQSKALAEALFLNANNTRGSSGPRYSVTRYGNVAFSRGSVIPKWKSMIRNRQPLIATDQQATRFWMTMDEACGLVLKTIALMPDHIMIPKLKSFRLFDLATALGAGKVIETGLPPWEKMHESLAEGYSSETSELMTVDELREAINAA